MRFVITITKNTIQAQLITTKFNICRRIASSMVDVHLDSVRKVDTPMVVKVIMEEPTVHLAVAQVVYADMDVEQQHATTRHITSHSHTKYPTIWCTQLKTALAEQLCILTTHTKVLVTSSVRSKLHLQQLLIETTSSCWSFFIEYQ